MHFSNFSFEIQASRLYSNRSTGQDIELVITNVHKIESYQVCMYLDLIGAVWSYVCTLSYFVFTHFSRFPFFIFLTHYDTITSVKDPPENSFWKLGVKKGSISAFFSMFHNVSYEYCII